MPANGPKRLKVKSEIEDHRFKVAKNELNNTLRPFPKPVIPPKTKRIQTEKKTGLWRCISHIPVSGAKGTIAVFISAHSNNVSPVLRHGSGTSVSSSSKITELCLYRR